MAGTNGRIAASPTTIDSLRQVLVGRSPRRTLARIVVVVVIAVLVFSFVLLPVRGRGPSMSPTLADGQLVFVNRLAYLASEPRRGDIVALGMAGARVVYVKRIIGLPGEHVRIDEGIVSIDDTPLYEPYVARRQPWTVPEVALGPDEYLVIGDNRNMPARSHDFGKARRERVLGRVIEW